MKNKSNFFRLLIIFLKPYWKLEAVASLCLIVMALMALAIPWITKFVIDEVIIGKNFQLLIVILLGMALIYVFRQVFFFLSHYLVYYVAGKAIFNIRNRLFRHLQYLSIKYYDKRKVGEILTRVISDVSAIQQLFISGVVTLILPAFTLLMALAIMIYINWKITLIAMFILPMYVWCFFHYRKRIQDASFLVREKISEMSGKLSEVISGVRVVRSFTAEGHECHQFSSQNNSLFNRQFGSNMLGVYLWMIADVLGGIGTGMILYFGTYSVIRGRMTLGELIAFLSYTGMLYNPIVQLSSLNNIVNQAIAGVNRIFEVLDTKGEEKRVRSGASLNGVKGHILFDHVSYSYDHKVPALKNIRLEALPGEVVALVGPSGCGKSTLMNLLLRFYDHTGGRIYLDGYDIANVDPRSIRETTGIVLQEVFLFSGSIEENIRYGHRDATRDEVISAAKAANAHNFIMRLPQGYARELQERGGGLSVGERQRIAIARAILRDPRILIFDEATSALDSRSEKVVQEALENVSKGRTTFIIAHRLSTILHADKIVVMEQGRILEIGTHEELFSRGNLYRELCETQSINV